jgi:hypothetical protein
LTGKRSDLHEAIIQGRTKTKIQKQKQEAADPEKASAIVSYLCQRFSG